MPQPLEYETPRQPDAGDVRHLPLPISEILMFLALLLVGCFVFTLLFNLVYRFWSQLYQQ